MVPARMACGAVTEKSKRTEAEIKQEITEDTEKHHLCCLRFLLFRILRFLCRAFPLSCFRDEVFPWGCRTQFV